MIRQLMPYFDKAANLVPGFGRKEAVLFTGALLLESVVRVGFDQNGGTIIFLDVIKNIQFYASFAKTSYGHSWANRLKAHCVLLPSNPLAILLIHQALDGEDRVRIVTDRPPLVSFAACAGEVVKIGAKIVGCLATGKVVGQMVNTQASDKVRMTVSAALLTLSALNIVVPSLEKKIQ